MKRLDPEKQGISFIFSDLETDILEIIWKKGNASSNLLYKILGDKYDVAASTISVTLNRLHKRDILDRRPEKGLGGTRYIYAPKFTKQELGDKMANKFLTFLRKSFGDDCIANLKRRLK